MALYYPQGAAPLGRPILYDVELFPDAFEKVRRPRVWDIDLFVVQGGQAPKFGVNVQALHRRAVSSYVFFHVVRVHEPTQTEPALDPLSKWMRRLELD